MKVATQVTKIKAAISKGLATQHPVKLVAGLGLGAVLMAGTALHFVPNSNNESGSAFSSDQQRAAERREEAQSIISWLNHSKPASPSYEQQRAADSLQERLEVQRVQEDMQNYHRGVSKPSYEEQRAAERHQENLDILEEALREREQASGILPEDDPYAYLTMEGFTHQLEQDEEGGEIGATRRSNWDRPPLDIAIERLEGQIDRLLADAAQDPSRNTPSLNREIERLDNEIDRLRLNAMQNQSADGPLSSEPSGTWPPDTKDYLDSDY